MKKMPSASAILLALLLVVVAASWLVPTVTFETTMNSELGYAVIDESTVEVGKPNRILPWQIPPLLIDGAQKVFSTSILICCCNGAFSVLNSAGVFSRLISRLCRRFKQRGSSLLLLTFVCFSLLGLVVPPHCFIAFLPAMVALATQMGYDTLVGLAIVMFGATTSAMTGPLSAVTAMCQESVGLPLYSGMGVRLFLFVVFLCINAAYLIGYAKKIQKEPSRSLMVGCPENAPEEMLDVQCEQQMSRQDVISLGGLILAFVIVVIGSTAFGFSTGSISAVFLTFALLIGFVLGFSVTKTVQQFGVGVQRSITTVIVISFAGAITCALEKAGIMSTLLYYVSKGFSGLPNALIPTAMLVIVAMLNCVLPSGPAKGVLLMPLLGPSGQMAGMSMQTSVLAYNLGDSITNYLLPYDSTTAAYLETAHVPFTVWVRFILKLFVLWTITSIVFLTILYYVGYGPF